MTAAYTETVTIVPSGGRDPQGGDPLPDEPEVQVAGCIVWPQDSSGNEQTFQQNLVPDGRAVLMPPGTQIKATDRVRYAGLLWDVAGVPVRWRSPLTGTAPGVQVALRRADG